MNADLLVSPQPCETPPPLSKEADAMLWVRTRPLCDGKKRLTVVVSNGEDTAVLHDGPPSSDMDADRVIDEAIEWLRGRGARLVSIVPAKLASILESRLAWDDDPRTPRVTSTDVNGRWHIFRRDLLCPQEPVRRVIVAADASLYQRGVGGAAAITDTGKWRTTPIDCPCTASAELVAILLAARLTKGRPATILSDSAHAVQLVNSTTIPRAHSTVLGKIAHAIKGRDVKVEWVRGHDGHPLNEAAHRLAFATYRKVKLGLPAEVHRQVCDMIASELPPVTSDDQASTGDPR